jgi:hypothetical protein
MPNEELDQNINIVETTEKQPVSENISRIVTDVKEMWDKLSDSKREVGRKIMLGLATTGVIACVGCSPGSAELIKTNKVIVEPTPAIQTITQEDIETNRVTSEEATFGAINESPQELADLLLNADQVAFYTKIRGGYVTMPSKIENEKLIVLNDFALYEMPDEGTPGYWLSTVEDSGNLPTAADLLAVESGGVTRVFIAPITGPMENINLSSGIGVKDLVNKILYTDDYLRSDGAAGGEILIP